MKNFLWFAFAVSTALLFFGCTEIGVHEPELKSDGTVTFIIGNDAAATKAAAQVAVYDLGADGLSIVETVSGMDGAGVMTKGTPVYTENFDSLYGTSLYATAYVPASGTGALTDIWGSFLENGGTVRFSNCAENTYSYDYSQGNTHLHWPSGGVLHYFLQAPYKLTGTLNPVFFADGRIEFDYADPTAPVDVEGRHVIADPATAQSDLLFASKMISGPSAMPETLLMYHALTAVKFKVGNQDDEVETIIRKVTFKGIKANGHCTVRPNASDKSSVCSSWTKHSVDDELVVDCSQTFSGTVDYDRDNSNFGDGFYNGTNLRNPGKVDGSEILMMVPQELKDTELEVEYIIKDIETAEEKVYKKSAKLSSVWKAGEIHTYTLTVNTVAVEVDDSMNDAGTVKSDVQTMNTGNVTSYLRASCCVAWYYGEGDDAVAVWPYENDGTFDGLGGNDTWILGSDGYYYYRYPVQPGNAAGNDLFKSFTAPSAVAPFAGAHLEMKILLQGVQYDADKSKVSSAWGDVFTVDSSGYPTVTSVVSQLSTTPETNTL